MPSPDQQKQNREVFLAVLTLMTLAVYLGVNALAVYQGTLTLKEFGTNLAPWSTLLLGYWARGSE